MPRPEFIEVHSLDNDDGCGLCIGIEDRESEGFHQKFKWRYAVWVFYGDEYNKESWDCRRMFGANELNEARIIWRDHLLKNLIMEALKSRIDVEEGKSKVKEFSQRIKELTESISQLNEKNEHVLTLLKEELRLDEEALESWQEGLTEDQKIFDEIMSKIDLFEKHEKDPMSTIVTLSKE